MKIQVLRYRTFLHVINDILIFCEESRLRYDILQKCSLNNDRVQWVKILHEKDLIEELGSGQFRTTQKGKEFMDHFNRITDLVNCDILNTRSKVQAMG